MICIHIYNHSRRTRDSGFVESEHPRADNGRFGTGSKTDAMSAVHAAPDHPGMGKGFVSPKDLGIHLVGGSVRAKVNAKILKNSPLRDFSISEVEVGQGYLSKEKLLNLIEHADDLNKNYLTVASKNGKNHLMDGNHRYAAMKLLGYKTFKAHNIAAEQLDTY